jgi:hypothetical protein
MKVVNVEGQSNLIVGDLILDLDNVDLTINSLRELKESGGYKNSIKATVRRMGAELKLTLTQGLSGTTLEMEDSSSLSFDSVKVDNTEDNSHHERAEPTFQKDSFKGRAPDDLGMSADSLDGNTSQNEYLNYLSATQFDESIPTAYGLSRSVLKALGALDVIFTLVLIGIWTAVAKDLGGAIAAVGMIVIMFILALSFMVRQIMKSMLDLSDSNREILYHLRAQSRNDNRK